MIGTKVALHDIFDAEGYVAFTIQKSRMRLSPADREELMAEGLAILSELASKYEAHREGYAQAGTFSGYAGSLLGKRLRDAYYRLHPEHLATRDEDGRRVYEYARPALSLQQEDMPELIASAYLGPHEYDQLPNCPTAMVASMPYEMTPVIGEALSKVPARFRLGGTARNVVRLIDEGYGTDEIAKQLRLDRGDVIGAQAAIGSAIWLVQTTTEAAA